MARAESSPSSEDTQTKETTGEQEQTSEHSAKTIGEPEQMTEPETSTESSAKSTEEPNAESGEFEKSIYKNSISGMLWLDILKDAESGAVYGNGIKDAGEGPVANLPVSLYKANDRSNAVQTVKTDKDGKFFFENIEPGSYVVGIKAEMINGTEYLLPLGGIANGNKFAIDTTEWIYAYTKTIEVEADSKIIGMDAGMRTPPKAQPMAGGYTVIRDDTSVSLGTYTTLAAAVSACLSGSVPCTITATADDTAMGALVGIPSGKSITLTSGTGGPYTITQATANTRHFLVNSGGSLTLTNIILAGGGTGGGIQNSGTLVMDAGAVIKDCYRNNDGGGVWNGGVFTINGGEISSNESTSGGGGVASHSAGTLTMTDGTISGNTAPTGGGVLNMGVFNMSGGAISSNTANCTSSSYLGGGGVMNYNTTAAFTMTGGTISGNIVTGSGMYANGGGVSSMLGTVTLDGGIISGNTAPQNGGGVWSQGTFLMIDGKINGNNKARAGGGVCNNAGTFTMTSGEINGNTATTSGGGVHNINGSEFYMNGGEISSNTAAYAGGGVYTSAGTYTGLFIMTNGKISDNKSNGTGSSYGGGGVYSGGSGGSTTGTFTMKGGEISGNTAAGRGGGVFNYNSATFTMEAGKITGSNTAPSGGGVYNGGNSASYPSTFDMQGGEISGNKATASYGGGGVYNTGAGGMFTMETGTKIIGNEAATYGGGVTNYNASTFDMKGGEISGNEAVDYGGGVFNYSGAVVYMRTSAEISGNEAQYGGGVFIIDGSAIDMHGGKISGNEASLSGGGVYNNASFVNMRTGTEISGNTAAGGSGGGVYCTGISAIYMETGAKASGNTAADDGGGLYVSSAALLFTTGAEISGNTAANGGGIYTQNVTDYTNLTLDGATVFSGNTATNGAVVPPLNAASYTTISTTSSSFYTHPLNHADINVLVREVTVYYVNRSGGAIGTPTSNTYYVADSGSFSLTAAQIPAITGYVFADWKEGSAGTLKNNTTVYLSSVTANMDIYLVYGNDRGATGEDPTDPGTTPDGIEDVVVTKEWYDTVGGFNMYPPGAQSKKIVNVGDSFDDLYTIIIGYDYDGYKIDGGTLQTGNPNITVAAGDSDFMVTYVYSRLNYQVRVDYELRDGSPVPGQPGFTRTPGYNTIYFPTALEIAISNYIYIGWVLDGVPQVSPAPSIVVPARNSAIILRYGRDSGTSGDIVGSGGETPNGVEDYDVTRKWELNDGSPIASLADEVQIWDVGDTFSDAHNSGVTIPTWLIYEGYRLSTDVPGDPLHTGTPSYTVNVTDGHVTVTYVYRAPQYTVTTHFVDRSGNAIGTPTTTTASVSHGNSFTATPQSIAGYTFVDWKEGAAGTLKGNTTPTVSNVTGAMDIYLVYGYDRGTHGESGPTGTPDGIEDILITKKYETAGGTTLRTSDSRIIEVGKAFTDTHPGITGYSYTGYRIDGGALQSGEPNIAVAAGDPDKMVTYIYSINSYNINVKYELRDGTSVPGTTDYTASATYNTVFVPVILSPTGFVLVGWKLNGTTMTGSPSITVPAATAAMTLVYGYDRGATGDDPTDPGTTPDGIEDIIVIKEFIKADGTMLKSNQTVIVNTGDTFSDVHDTITGHNYQGHKLNGGSLQNGEPNLLVGAISRAATVVYNNTTVSYIYTATQYTITVKAVDENGKSIGSGSYDWTADKSYQESFTAIAPTVQGYTYQSWKLNGTPQSGDIKIASVEAAAAITLVYKTAEESDESDYGNYELIKKPNIKNVAAGQTVVYTFSGFGNKWPVSLEKYTISDKPDKGLDFVSAKLSAFTNGTGITYDIVYFTNLSGKQIMHSNVPADSAFSFTAPKLKSGEYITAVTLDFGTVPAGFAVGDTMQMTFRVWDNPPSQTLTNIGILSYKVNGKDKEFITGSGAGSITIDGYFGTPKTGDSSIWLWISLMGLAIGGAVLLPAAYRRRKRRTQQG